MDKFVRLIEVGPRDGLQNEKVQFSVDQKVQLIRSLKDAGLRDIEIGAFVSPRWIPQMVGTEEVYQAIKDNKQGGIFWCFAPNVKGVERAISVGMKHIMVFLSATEMFFQKNVNCSREEGLRRIRDIMTLIKDKDIYVSCYVSVSFGCPYEGVVRPEQTMATIEKLQDYNVHEISIGDTIGCATPKSVQNLLNLIQSSFPLERIRMHFHDTRGMAIANIFQSLQMGVRAFDSSIGGLGGCPYVKIASANVATEDVVYLLDKEGFHSGVSIEKLLDIQQWISKIVGRSLSSHLGQSGLP